MHSFGKYNNRSLIVMMCRPRTKHPPPLLAAATRGAQCARWNAARQGNMGPCCPPGRRARSRACGHQRWDRGELDGGHARSAGLPGRHPAFSCGRRLAGASPRQV